MVAVVKPLLSRKDKAKLSTMLLQEFGVAALMLPTTAEMVLRNCGLTTGIVVDIGVDATHPPVSFEIQKDLASWALAADTQLYLGPEVLFQPSLHLQGSTWGGLHDALLRSVDLCDPIVQDELLGAVVLSGRVSKLPGLKRRLVKEVVVSRHELLGKVHAFVPDHIEYQSYWGACTLAQYASDDQWQLE
ncbi:hypothetical protein DYB37_001858 [Aphanomyces astaci]|uniref:Uncharacterized protein n=1 Tax=Aphanomyces astaci TaxID=112090 RepID=A0A3L6UPG9_APHAT|nr:hypothetical protein DYB35_000572 [Aphanomyces astaci]RHZ20194.1 hypothetical protein DYB37_001858 [Aphanomyces astaci]RLN86853.1 hypothetical protein DYB28_009384 [Aphanomyces astaci]